MREKGFIGIFFLILNSYGFYFDFLTNQACPASEGDREDVLMGE
jgi:hypothetical protein